MLCFFYTTDIASSSDVPASTSTTAKPTAVMSKTVPTSTAVVKTTSPTPISRDCSDISDQGYTENYGIYRIQPSSDFASFEVVCDLGTNGQKWVIFQRRFDGSENFDLPWDDYKNGFGNLTGEHWLGLEKLDRLTRNGAWQLRVELKDFYNNTAYAEYSNFAIGNATTHYRLSIGEYSGTARDSLRSHANTAFSTYDQDHDTHDGINCASYYEGAWWYRSCGRSNLNGLYLGSPVNNFKGMTWYNFNLNGTEWEVLKKSEMKIRRIG